MDSFARKFTKIGSSPKQEKMDHANAAKWVNEFQPNLANQFKNKMKELKGS